MVKAFKNSLTENGGMEDEGDACELADNEVTQLTEGSCEVTVSNEFGNENEKTGPNLEDEQSDHTCQVSTDIDDFEICEGDNEQSICRIPSELLFLHYSVSCDKI